MASEDTTLVVALEARVDAFEKAFNKAGKIADTKFSAIERRTKQAGDKMREELSSSVESINRVLGAIGVGLALDQLREMADNYATLSARINAASGSAAKGAAVMERLGQIAQRTRTSSDATAAGYLRMHQTMQDLGYSTATQLKLQEALNDAFKVSGTSADGASGIQEALTAALATGSLSAKQLNEMLEQSPRLAKALADGLGVPTTQLKLLAEQGKLTSTAIVQSLVGALGRLRQEPAAMPETMGEAMQRLKDAMSDYVGKTTQASGVTGGFVSALNLVSDNLDKIGPVALAAGLAIAGVFTASAVIANPFLAVSAAVAGAAVALDEFLGKIEPIEGQMATLKDYGAAVFAELKSGAVEAGQGLQHAFVVSVNAIIDALEYGEDANISFGDKVAAVAAKIMEAWHAIGGVITKTAEAFADAGITLLNTMLVPLEEDINKVIGLLNRAIEAANKLGASLKPIPEMTVKVFKDPYAGKANDLVGAAGDAITGEAKKIQRDANKRAVERDANSPTAGAGEGKGNGAIDSGDHGHNPPNVAFEKYMADVQAQIRDMQAETEARKNFVGTFEEEEAAVKRAETAQRLLNEAQKDGVELNDDTISKISALADAYSKASSEAEALAKTEADAKKNAKELSDTGEDMAKGFVKDLASGKGAAEALRNALAKLGDKMLDMGMDAFWKSMTNNGTAFEGLARAITPAEPVVNAPGSSLAEVKKLAAGMKTAQMSVTAGSVTVNGPGSGEGGTPAASTASGADTSGAGGIGSDAKYPTTDTTPTGSLGGGNLHDRNLGMLPGGAAAVAGATGLHDRNLGAGYGLAGALHAPNQFQSVTGTRFNGHQPSQSFLDGPNTARRAQIEGSTGSLDRWGRDQRNFTAASRAAYGPGTNIGYRDNMLANGGQIYGGSVFNTAMTPPVQAPALADASQNVTKFTQSLTTADGGLNQFSGSLGGGGGAGGVGGLGSIFGGLFSGGFAGGGMINGDGTPTSDSNIALVSDGEFIVNAKAASRNKALLNAINSGKAPKFSGSSQAAFLNSNSQTNHVNIHVEGGAADRQLISP